MLRSRLITSEKTKKNYRGYINSYFRVIGQDIDTYFTKKRDYEKDLQKAYEIYVSEKKSILTIKVTLNAVKLLMEAQRKELGDLDFWKHLTHRMRGAEPANDETVLNRTDIKSILSHGNALSRALFLILASSGRRIGEVLSLNPEDVHADDKVAWINIRKTLGSDRTKTGMKTRAFISDEAASAYKTWMKERDRYLIRSLRRAKTTPLKAQDSRVFPMSYSNALLIWYGLVVKAGYAEGVSKPDKNGHKHIHVKRMQKYQRAETHPHCLRKFFRSYFGDSDLSEFLMGHGSRLTKTYRCKTPEDLAMEYRKHMGNISIFETPDIKEELENKETRITSMEQKLTVMYDTMITNQALFEGLKAENARLQKALKDQLPKRMKA